MGHLQEELTLLNHSIVDSENQSNHELMTAPLITREAYIEAGFHSSTTQYGVLGSAKRI